MTVTAARAPAGPDPLGLAALDLATPFLACDLGTVAGRYAAFRSALPGVACFYAMKCNGSPEILRSLAALGCGFEIASIGELRALRAVDVDPATVLFSNPVKVPAHVEEAYAAGLWRFSFDSAGELRKLARHAPGSAVYLRIVVDDSSSMFPLSAKLGAQPARARELFRTAAALGLRPYGLTFHVGSQCADPQAWVAALRTTGDIMAQLRRDGIRLDMLDLGGGFPVPYVEPAPSIVDIARAVRPALERLPYRPALIAAEPGRYLVAEAGVLVAGVIGRSVRGGTRWLHLDAGAYNGLLDAQQMNGRWHLPVWTSRPDGALAPFTLTGPTCDSTDTVYENVLLPTTVDVGDRVYLGHAGAYTLSFASHFNGFAPPATTFLS
ncbi:ornithine decarboxylase [Virgisporangium aliadipatigenens]|uniref:ornithine decarboxylase n=1 Tax=Virgisporangium aliadipatigenens TaxID=741659 RepID=A0A8J3YH01_9ACTN|nr:type III PLP-dependent enzyme [Virgisporangium aliadipatigenens]GIJ43791.1 ornithine decarboxylase [Virgisporangium aliadipatigenens]